MPSGRPVQDVHASRIFPQGSGSRLNAEFLQGQSLEAIYAYIAQKITEALAGFNTTVSWGDIQGKPAGFEPTRHTHDINTLKLATPTGAEGIIVTQEEWDTVVNELARIRKERQPSLPAEAVALAAATVTGTTSVPVAYVVGYLSDGTFVPVPLAG